MNTKTVTLILLAAGFLACGCADISEEEITGGDIDRTLPAPDGDDEAIETDVFTMLNLDWPGLEQVKAYYEDGEYYKAAYELREYWRNRGSAFNPEVDLLNTSITAIEQHIADQALEYRFRVSNFCEKNPDGSGSINGDETFYCFLVNDEIDWTLNDNLVNNGTSGLDQEWWYQKHRHQWMEPQAKAYWISRNEAYILNWIEVYSDWMDTYPCKMESMPVGGNDNNVDYEWKGLQVAERVLSQINIIPYYIQSENFTPEWLCAVLHAFGQSVEQMRLNYYEDGNILITQAQAVTFAGVLMPEFKNSETWASEGAGKLREGLDQFNEDGVHYQLDPSYHISAIADFMEITEMLDANGRSDLLGNVLETLEAAMAFVADITYPDYSIDNFNDTRSVSYTPSVLKRNFNSYSEAFPSNSYFRYMATEGADGSYPSTYMSNYTYSGYYVMRNGWSDASTMMVLKNCYDPINEWHNQPDNGTFGIWHRGRNFFPDAGVYSYSEGNDRTTYANTTNHNTVTIETHNYSGSYKQGHYAGSGTVNGNTDYIVTTHEMAEGVQHRRAVFFVDREFFVIVDDIYGATGEPVMNLHFHLTTGDSEATVVETPAATGTDVSAYTAGAHTAFSDGNNMLCRTFLEAVPASADDYNFNDLHSNVSNAISTVSGQRTGYRVGAAQPEGGAVRFITVIYPFSDSCDGLSIEAEFTDNGTTGTGAVHSDGSAVMVTVNGTEYYLSYSL